MRRFLVYSFHVLTNIFGLYYIYDWYMKIFIHRNDSSIT